MHHLLQISGGFESPMLEMSACLCACQWLKGHSFSLICSSIRGTTQRGTCLLSFISLSLCCPSKRVAWVLSQQRVCWFRELHFWSKQCVSLRALMPFSSGMMSRCFIDLLRIPPDSHTHKHTDATDSALYHHLLRRRINYQ